MILVDADGVPVTDAAGGLVDAECPAAAGCACAAVYARLRPCAIDPILSPLCPPPHRADLYAPVAARLSDGAAMVEAVGDCGLLAGDPGRVVRVGGVCYRVVSRRCSGAAGRVLAAEPLYAPPGAAGGCEPYLCLPAGAAVLAPGTVIEPVDGCGDGRCSSGVGMLEAAPCGGAQGPAVWVCASIVDRARVFRYRPAGGPELCYCVRSDQTPLDLASLPADALVLRSDPGEGYADCCRCRDVLDGACLTGTIGGVSPLAAEQGCDGTGPAPGVVTWCCCGPRATALLTASVLIVENIQGPTTTIVRTIRSVGLRQDPSNPGVGWLLIEDSIRQTPVGGASTLETVAYEVQAQGVCGRCQRAAIEGIVGQLGLTGIFGNQPELWTYGTACAGVRGRYESAYDLSDVGGGRGSTQREIFVGLSQPESAGAACAGCAQAAGAADDPAGEPLTEEEALA